MNQLDEKMTCPKCGFRSGYQKDWQVEWKERCYGTTCDWNDKDVSEHLHQVCPTCGWKRSCATGDYETLKNGWTTGNEEKGSNVTVTKTKATPPAASAQPRVISGRASNGRAVTTTTPPASTGFRPAKAVDPWKTECTGCPCSDDK